MIYFDKSHYIWYYEGVHILTYSLKLVIFYDFGNNLL